MTASSAPPSALSSSDQLGRLYAQSARRLERRVRAGVRAPDPVIEDACQLAWSRLIRRPENVRAETALGWLATTATHEALKLLGRELREASLEDELEHRGEGAVQQLAPGPEELLDVRHRLTRLDGVNERQKRLLWLNAIGLSYTEMARHEGCSRRTVERQILRARRALRPSRA